MFSPSTPVTAPRFANETWWTWANAVTTIRTIAGVVIFGIAAYRRDETLNLVGLGVYWVLDILDGYLARKLDQETRIGAQYDILSDRLLVAMFYGNYVVLHPETLVPVALFLFEFMLLDHFLSNQFMRWPILSPNYFDQVDKQIFALNWSPLAKAANSGLVTVLLVVTRSVLAATITIGFIIGIKIYSLVLLRDVERRQAPL